MLISRISAPAGVLASVAAVVLVVAAQPQGFTPQSLRSQGLACPPGMVLEAEAARRDTHAETGNASRCQADTCAHRCGSRHRTSGNRRFRWKSARA